MTIYRLRAKLIFLLTILMFFTSCGDVIDEQSAENQSVQPTNLKFEKLSPEKTGIYFSNNITETEEFNYFNFEYIYNGGGVAVGDINNDGLSDIYFTGNQVSDKLYLNKGGMQFEDITATAIGELAGIGWHTGVVMEDVNQDGWLDIYVCRSGEPNFYQERENLLFINNGDLTFSEKAEEYGVNIASQSIHAIFFDLENDGDLDLYVTNHPLNAVNTGDKPKSVQEVMELGKKGNPFSDRLLENVDGKFKDITMSSGISNYSFGLGLAVSDFNNDGLCDIYVGNDYMASDYLYINQGNKTFKEQVRSRTKHISNNSMGNDVADYNNDGFVDIISVDMVSEDHIRSKKNMGGMNIKKFWDAVHADLHYQYMFNTLQLNNGNGSFSEIGQLAGIAKTDWSWAPLFADFDNDGWKDLFITNGYRRDTRDTDFNNKKKSMARPTDNFQEVLDLIPATKITNYIFRNNHELVFEKKMDDWGFKDPVNSNGAAYADLDNDGDLDLIMNNMDEVSFIMENKLETQHNFLRFELDNKAIGASIKLFCKDQIQYQEFQPSRGYQSSVERFVHFGMGECETVDRVEIKWPGGKGIVMTDVATNQVLKISSDDAGTFEPKKNSLTPIFKPGNAVQHKDEQIVMDDFGVELLMPHKMSQLGPFISAGDVDGNGKEDCYISGNRTFSGKLYMQDEKGNFKEKSGPWNQEKDREEMGSLFFDADNDGDLDLYVVSGSNEYLIDHPLLMDQLYINDGKGNFSNETAKRLPPMQSSGQRIVAGDYDKDGDLDLFVGGRQTPAKYPHISRSYLLQNDNGVFKDVTNSSGDLTYPGMITESLFSDFDGDGDLDLICVGEWMPISFYKNENGHFSDVTISMGTHDLVGWWYSISQADFNGDGKMDYVVGNIGANNKFHPAKNHPLEIYCNDFDQNGTFDIVLAKHQGEKCYPVRGRSCSSEQMPFVAQKFPTYNEFANATLDKIYGKESLDTSLHFSATEFKSLVLMSRPTQGFDRVYLSNYAQMGPINKSIIRDVNKDGQLDIIAVGNNYGAEVETMRYDGGRGIVLLGSGDGNFSPLSPLESGFFVNTDAKDMVMIGNLLLVTSNADVLKCFTLND